MHALVRLVTGVTCVYERVIIDDSVNATSLHLTRDAPEISLRRSDKYIEPVLAPPSVGR